MNRFSLPAWLRRPAAPAARAAQAGTDPSTALQAAPFLALALVLTGYMAPWVAHRAAGLAVTGYELCEQMKFYPAVSSGAVPLWREAFLLPEAAAAVLLALWANASTRRPLLRVLGLAAALGLALRLLPPYPFLLSAHRDPQWRGQLVVALSSALGSGLLALAAFAWPARRLPALALAASTLALALVGCVPAVWQFARAFPIVAAVYGPTARVGWGPFGVAVGYVLLAACVWPLRLHCGIHEHQTKGEG